MSTWATCDFTVASPTISSAAISAFDMPRAMSTSTSRSRWVSASSRRASAARRRRPMDELVDQPAGHGGGEQGVAGGDDADGVQQLVAGRRP